MLTRLSNAFRKVIHRDATEPFRLGCPAPDADASKRRMQAMFELTGGRGFRQPKTPPKVDAQGRTRGDRKRALRDAANAKERVRQMYARADLERRAALLA